MLIDRFLLVDRDLTYPPEPESARETQGLHLFESGRLAVAKPTPEDDQGETDASERDAARFRDRADRNQVLVQVAVVLGFVEVGTVRVCRAVAREALLPPIWTNWSLAFVLFFPFARGRTIGDFRQRTVDPDGLQLRYWNCRFPILD